MEYLVISVANIDVYIVHTISIFFDLALGKRKKSQAAKSTWQLDFQTLL